MRTRKVEVLLVAVLAGGCASTHAYRSELPANLTMTAKVSGSVLSTVSARVHIHAVGTGCRPTYRGTVDLDRSRTAVGIPVGSPSYFVFEFPRFSLLPLASTSASFETLLAPRPGYHYEIEASYGDDLYGATIYERLGKSGVRREITSRPLTPCGQ